MDDGMERVEVLKAKLREIAERQDAEWFDIEADHVQADDALLEYINDPDVTELFNSLTLWYA